MSSSYFPQQRSSYDLYQGDVADTLQLIGDRYIGHQPKQPFVFRASNTSGFKRSSDYRYEINVDDKIGQIEDGHHVYAWAKLWCEEEEVRAFRLSCFGPTRIYLNGQSVYRSNIQEDVFPDRASWFRLTLKRGWNHFVLHFIKTGTGCGCRFGTGSIKGHPFHFIVPTEERGEQEGWIYTLPQAEELAVIPNENTSEEDTGLDWLPRQAWTQEEQEAGCFARTLGTEQGRVAWAWSKLSVSALQHSEAAFTGIHHGSIAIFIDGDLKYSSDHSGLFSIRVPLAFGEHDIAVRSVCTETRWGFQFTSFPGDIHLSAPVTVHGYHGEWLIAGTFDPSCTPDIRTVCTLDTVFQNDEGGTYWRADMPNTFVRPFIETTHYGRWNYPLGVTLYGLLKTGTALERNDYAQYVLDHIELCTSYFVYSLWDKIKFGAAGVNHQLSAIDSLDDCGSFASTMLYAYEYKKLKGAKETADHIADYIGGVQDRLSDGALYRVHGSTDFMQDTMWCDDLYMSTPFLCRYYQLTSDRSYLDDAAQQFLLYKKYLYMPERKLMSHVYDFKFNQQTKVAWGRGNGWVLFSLTELLEVLPDDHAMRDELLNFFEELCEGYLAQQGKNGLWHQVLDMHDSYEETSATSMFIYAFARAVRYGWLKTPDPYVSSVMRGWEGICRTSVDHFGNVYGVCRGSGYSFSPLYYKDELDWNLNDTHGIGIVMLAGIETLHLQKHLQQTSVSA
ncbi:glycoside hydrolase family 105 protein [Marinicrinis lubricantis]|uniref:Glycoside hydrolase family 105 protein n=1 Tax=Marinicrinis lubricantis TaxID=2086470 RepID=A0ABW1IJE4_9BACL